MIGVVVLWCGVVGDEVVYCAAWSICAAIDWGVECHDLADG